MDSKFCARKRLGNVRASSSMLAVIIAMTPGLAFAQTAPTAPVAAAPETESAAIVVTGTISRNPASATASPVTRITTEDLAKRGITTVTDALQQLTANNAGTDPASWTSHGFATGASTVSLRGLNDAYTLILFDGLRTAPYPLADDGTRTIVDVNSIPDAVVQNIDVLQDGASATYGSDAVAGVVNVIVKPQVEGVHLNGSGAISQRGDAGERRLDATIGYGKLTRDGFNIYVNGEYQKNDALYLDQRGSPFDNADLSSYCVPSIVNGSTVCGVNGVSNGLQQPGAGVNGTGYNGFVSTTVAFVRPYSFDPVTGAVVASQGGYQFANPAAGCGNLTALTLTAAQRAIGGTSNGQSVYPGTVCQLDLQKTFGQYDAPTERKGGTLRGTLALTPTINAYAMANYYQVKVDSTQTAGGFTGTAATAPDGGQVTINGVYLPVYVCPQGVGAIVGGNVVGTGCNAANGTLNPNNPFAAIGQDARLVVRNNLPREVLTKSQTYRIAGGINGIIGNGFDFGVDATHSEVTLDRVQKGYFYIQGLLNAVSQGTFNFDNFSANSAAARQILFPDNYNHSISKLTQVLGHVGKDLFQLPGGSLNVTVGAEYRYEAIHAPSPNPSNANPDLRYYTLNAAGVDGARSQYSFNYDIAAPILDSLRVKAEGSYEHYSTGQSRFSPKFEAEFSPIKAIKFRGTYGKGFRIPNFVESFGLPTTGFVSSAIPCAKYVAFCAAHASNPTYYQNAYAYGLTSIANPNLNPEKSTNFTAGMTFEPNRKITLTADFWYVKINGLIIPATASQAVLDQYYENNGVVTIPGFKAAPTAVDPQNPNALPLLGTLAASFTNAGSLKAEGIDFSGTLRLPIGHDGLRAITQGTATYLSRLEQVQADGTLLRYDGTLGPCNVTSCSGAPKWRFIVTQTLDFNGKGQVSLTGYYTSGYSDVATDEGGVYGNCAGSIGEQVTPANDTVTPLRCNGKASFDLDLTGSIKIADHLTLYANILNLIDEAPSFDPSAGYGLYNFNPAWQDKQFIGRYFRVGAKVDF